MIKVDRTAIEIPPNLATEGAAELVQNEGALAAGEKLTFNAYSREPVKGALKDIFGLKCGFCESLLMGTQPGDVEHFRPKGKVVVVDMVTGAKTSVTGYYWLAADWTNLLLSCADCNRPRTQTDYDGNKRVIGKSNFFPLANEAHRATKPAMIAAESPLLLDPCRDDPALHIAFTDAGGVRPAIVGGAPSAKGVATIHYCGLARAELLQMRARHRWLVMAAIRHIVNALEAGNDPGADLDDLVRMLEPTEPYVAFTRFLVKEHLGNYLESLDLDLEDAVIGTHT